MDDIDYENKVAILHRVISNVERVESSDVKIHGFFEGRFGVTVSYTAGDEKKIEKISWWRIIMNVNN